MKGIMVKGSHQMEYVRHGTQHVGSSQGGGTPMRMPSRDERMAPCRYQAARVQLHCPTIDTHTRQLILEQATIYPDGWARWGEDGHVIVGYLQAGRCCDPPEVSEL
jgi:hypothetical protein